MELVWILIIGGGIGFLVLLLKKSENRVLAGPEKKQEPEPKKSQEEIQREQEEQRKDFLEKIEAFLADRTNSLEVSVGPWVEERKKYLHRMVHDKMGPGESPFQTTAGGVAKVLLSTSARAGQSVGIQSQVPDFTVVRPLASMSDQEIGLLRIVASLNAYGVVSDETLYNVELGIAYGGGQGSLKPPERRNKYTGDAQQALGEFLAKTVGPPSVIFNEVIKLVNQLMATEQPPEVARILRRVLQSGQDWLSAADVPGSIYDREQGESTGLFIGNLVGQESTVLAYHGTKSLVTIAPSGSGKTQCNVFPNLLSYPGPVVVLDIKGECWRETSAWRAANVGPVYRFDPTNPENSVSYNPLAVMRRDKAVVWGEAKALAQMLNVQFGNKPDIWDASAVELLTGLVAWVAGFPDSREHERHMGKVLDALAGGPAWEAFVEEAGGQQELSALRRCAMTYDGMRKNTPKQFEGVSMHCRQTLSVWEGPNVEAVTQQLDWHPERLLQAPYPSIYICIPPRDIRTYASLLRTVIAQHIGVLTEGNARPLDPVLFMLDELPQLGYMEPVKQVLELGRGYGIRAWLFAQSFSQLGSAYGPEVAEGMLTNCAVRIFMNPSQQDGSAGRLSRMLGEREGLLEGGKKPLVEETELVGPDFRDRQIVFGEAAPPACVWKCFAYDMLDIKEEMGEYQGPLGEASWQGPRGEAPSPTQEEIT